MDKRASCFRGKWKQLYHSASIQLILSVAFTTVAVTGMLFLGVALMLRFSSSSNAMAAESSQRVLAQVNLNLDSYLRNMMRVSDTVYYRVIKNTDLQREDMARELRDALDLLYAKDREVLVSLAVFDGSGSLVSATPLSELKNSVTPAVRAGSPPPWSVLKTCTSPHPTCKICLMTPIRGITGWSLSAVTWNCHAAASCKAACCWWT